jgi:hypothetical protein
MVAPLVSIDKAIPKSFCGKVLPELPDETIVRGTGDSFLGAAP